MYFPCVCLLTNRSVEALENASTVKAAVINRKLRQLAQTRVWRKNYRLFKMALTIIQSLMSIAGQSGNIFFDLIVVGRICIVETAPQAFNLDSAH